MTTSLVVRLTAIVSAIVVLAFAAGAWIVHLSTETTYRDVQREVEIRTGPQPPTGGLDAAVVTREERRVGGRVEVQEFSTIDAGAAFASKFWRTAAIWLTGVLIAAVGCLVWVMHRSLAPIADLVMAARTLQRGGTPHPLRPSGAAEFRELVDAFNSAAESIARTERVRRDLISDIAHELRTPLTNIRGQLEAVQAGLVRPEGECLATLQSEAKLLERLVSDIHQLALSDAGQLRVHLQPLPLRETIEQLATPLAAAAGARLTISGPSDLWCVADDERLRQVLGNLIENSARHRPDGLEITITLLREGPWATANIGDNGPGVAAADQPHIFDRFYRADKSRSRATGGAGLGLTIVRGLLHAMGGSIRYEDRASGGATFVVSLPAALASGVPIASQAPARCT